MKMFDLKNKNFAFDIISRDKAEYLSLQKVVSAKYKNIYSANIIPTPDMFALLREDRACHINGACFGITIASKRKLFSEQYLQMPIEDTLKRMTGVGLSRDSIAEVGSLVSYQSPGAGTKLVEMIPWIIWTLGYKYVLITATEKLQEIFKITQVPFQAITPATIHQVTEDSKSNWGSYYETQPITGIINIELAIYKAMHHHYTGKFNIRSVDIFKESKSKIGELMYA